MTDERDGERGSRVSSIWLSSLLITILAFAIRLAGLGSKSLWIDEADSFFFASQSLSDIFFNLCDPHPPGYYALLHGFLELGRSEFWVRLPSAIIGALTVPLLFALGRDLADRRTAILASLLLAVAPLHVWYAQEARMYVLVTALGIVGVHFAMRVVWRGRKRDRLAYLLVATAAIFVDHSALVPLLLANLWWFGHWTWYRLHGGQARVWELVQWIGLQVIVVMAFWLWWSRALFPSRFDSGVVYQQAMVLLTLERLGWSINLTELCWTIAGVGVTMIALGGLAVWLLVRQRWVARWMSLFPRIVLIVYLLVTLASVVPRVFTVKRLVLSLLPFGLLVAAWAIRKLRWDRRQIALLMVYSIVLCAINIWLVPKEPWREAVAAVVDQMEGDDRLWVDEIAVPAFDYYYEGSQRRSVWYVSRLDEPLQPDQEGVSSAVGSGRVWIITMVDAYRNLFDYLPVSLTPVWSNDWHRISVRAFQKPVMAPGMDVLEPPTYLLTWPSPIHEICDGQE